MLRDIIQYTKIWTNNSKYNANNDCINNTDNSSNNNNNDNNNLAQVWTRMLDAGVTPMASAYNSMIQAPTNTRNTKTTSNMCVANNRNQENNLK